MTPNCLHIKKYLAESLQVNIPIPKQCFKDFTLHLFRLYNSSTIQIAQKDAMGVCLNCQKGQSERFKKYKLYKQQAGSAEQHPTERSSTNREVTVTSTYWNKEK